MYVQKGGVYCEKGGGLCRYCGLKTDGVRSA